MVNVVVMSKLLNEGEYFFNPREFPEAPKIDDYINILSFVKGEIQLEIEEYLKAKNKISLGKVDARNWAYDEGQLLLYVYLKFDDIIDGDSTNNALLFPG